MDSAIPTIFVQKEIGLFKFNEFALLMSGVSTQEKFLFLAVGTEFRDTMCEHHLKFAVRLSSTSKEALF